VAFEGPIEGFPEYGCPREQLVGRARQLDWYHSLQLDPDFTTRGIFSLDEFVPFYLLPASLEGLDCLDVGTGNGYWAFLMEKRGAQSVVATDIADYFDTDFSVLDGREPPCPAPSPEGAYGEPFRVAATLLSSRVRYAISSAYALSPQTAGSFDLVFCGSVLMHLFAPLLALQRMAKVCRNTLLLTTQTDLALDGAPLVRYRGHEIPYVHFIPSPTCLVNMLEACGYQRVLRGPTFLLRFRDRERNPDELVHTTVIALKNAEASCLPLPQPRVYRRGERECGIEFVSPPEEVAPGATFDVLVRVSNHSSVPWRGDGEGIQLTLGFDAGGSAASAQLRRWTTVPCGTSFVDYLPSGVSTLVRLRVVAPDTAATLEIRPVVYQGSTRFAGCDRTLRVKVAGHRPWGLPLRRSMPEPRRGSPPAGRQSWTIGLLRRVDVMLQASLGAWSGGRWYQRVRATLARTLRRSPPA
jgi:tRNA (mo5U34)-methyltransferase